MNRLGVAFAAMAEGGGGGHGNDTIQLGSLFQMNSHYEVTFLSKSAGSHTLTQ